MAQSDALGSASGPTKPKTPAPQPRSQPQLPAWFQQAALQAGANAAANAVANAPAVASWFNQTTGNVNALGLNNQTAAQRAQNAVNTTRAAVNAGVGLYNGVNQLSQYRNVNTTSGASSPVVAPASPNSTAANLSSATGPNWTRPDWVPPADYRQTYANMLMNPDEYLRRRDATNRQNSPSYNAWVQSAANTPNQPHDINSTWRAQNPMPQGFTQSNQEYTVRNNAAPPGYYYTPFGSSYAKKPTLPSLTGNTSNAGGTGWGFGYGRGYGGGGGGGYADVNSWYNSMVAWNLTQIKGG